MRLDNIISDELQDQIAALSSFAFTTHIDVVMVNACHMLHHCINSSCYDSLSLNLSQVCFSGDGNYAATITPANLERLFQAAVVEVRFFSELLLWTLLCATSYLWFFMFFFRSTVLLSLIRLQIMPESCRSHKSSCSTSRSSLTAKTSVFFVYICHDTNACVEPLCRQLESVCVTPLPM